MKTKEMDFAKSTDEGGRSDSDREGRTAEPTLRKARVGLLLASGQETQLGPAMRREGYAESTSHAPKRNGVTVAGAIQAALETFPGSPSLASLRAKSLKTVDKALDDVDTPSIQRSQLAVAVMKHAAEVGEPEHAGDGARFLWRQRRYGRKLMYTLLRSVERDGIEAVWEKLASIEERDVLRFPRPVRWVVAESGVSSVARQRIRERKTE